MTSPTSFLTFLPLFEARKSNFITSPFFDWQNLEIIQLEFKALSSFHVVKDERSAFSALGARSDVNKVDILTNIHSIYDECLRKHKMSLQIPMYEVDRYSSAGQLQIHI